MTFNNSTGKFTLSNPSSSWRGMSYWEIIADDYDINSIYPYSDGWKYFKSGNVYYELRAAIIPPYSGSAKVYRYNVAASIKYS